MSAEGMYTAQIMAGSLMVTESREIARLLLSKPDRKAWKQAVETDNILMKQSPATANRQAKLIRNRLETMAPEFWEIVARDSFEVATQALLAASVKHSRLLGDFMLEIVKAKHFAFEKAVSLKDWDTFFEGCESREPGIADWTATTKRKIPQVVFRILAEAKYLADTKSLRLTPVNVLFEVRDYLERNNEKYVLECMTIYE